MNVEDPSWKSPEQRLLDHTHKAGQDDKIDPGFTKKTDHSFLGLRGHPGAERAGSNIPVRNAEFFR